MKKLMIVALLALGGGLVACTAATGNTGDESIAQDDDALINNGGGGLGYQCTTTSAGTNCTCTDGVDTSDPQTCQGMNTYCHDHGWTINCTWPPGGKFTCSCGNVAKTGSSSSSGIIFTGGGQKVGP